MSDGVVARAPETPLADYLAVRVGTWNVQSAQGAEPNAARLAWMLTLDCDAWVLTETNDELALPAPYKPLSGDLRLTAREGGRWVTIWSRLSGRRLATADQVRTVAAELDGGIIIFGTVLPWHTDTGPTPDPTQPLRSWGEFERVTPLQSQEWQALQKSYPDALLVVAGDLNQSLGSTPYYESVATRQLLCDCFQATGLTCLTDGDHLPEVFREIPLIDHVCAVAPAGAVVSGADYVVWPGRTPEGIKLSDHSGVAVTVRLGPAGGPGSDVR